MEDRLVEVVLVECCDCGLVSNDLTDWECIYNEIYDVWSYLCPECARR